MAVLLVALLRLRLLTECFGEPSPRTLPVLMLAAFLRRSDHDPGRQVRQTHTRVGLVAVLAASPRGTERVNAHVASRNLDLGGPAFIDDGDDHMTGVPAAALLSDRNPLDAMVANQLVQTGTNPCVKDGLGCSR